MRKIFRLLETSRKELLLFVAAFTLLNSIRIGLFMLPFARLLSLLKLIDKLSALKIVGQAKISTILHVVHTSSYYSLGNSKCLAKALTTQTLMKMFGHPSELKIGVARENNGSLLAHAWVEHHGKVIIGGLRNLNTFKTLTSL